MYIHVRTYACMYKFSFGIKFYITKKLNLVFEGGEQFLFPYPFSMSVSSMKFSKTPSMLALGHMEGDNTRQWIVWSVGLAVVQLLAKPNIPPLAH